MDFALTSLLAVLMVAFPSESSKLPRSPQVHENTSEIPPAAKFQKFDFAISKNGQIDFQKLRYYQQQQAEKLRQPFTTRRFIPIVVKKREAHDYNLRYPVYFVPNHIHYGLLRDGFGRSLPQQGQNGEIVALNALMGKTPLVQLQGLKQLLQPQDHKPITEQVVDVANPQTRPNVKVEHAPPEYQEVAPQALQDTQDKFNQNNLFALDQIQQELNSVAQAQAQEIIAGAQQAALQEEALSKQKESDAAKHDLQYASQYAFGYNVRDLHSGNNFGHEEVHDGKTARGRYHVLLPDGRLQKVRYWADESGFHAEVSYEGIAQH